MESKIYQNGSNGTIEALRVPLHALEISIRFNNPYTYITFICHWIMHSVTCYNTQTLYYYANVYHYVYIIIQLDLSQLL